MTTKDKQISQTQSLPNFLEPKVSVGPNVDLKQLFGNTRGPKVYKVNKSPEKIPLFPISLLKEKIPSKPREFMRIPEGKITKVTTKKMKDIKFINFIHKPK